MTKGQRLSTGTRLFKKQTEQTVKIAALPRNPGKIKGKRVVVEEILRKSGKRLFEGETKTNWEEAENAGKKKESPSKSKKGFAGLQLAIEQIRKLK